MKRVRREHTAPELSVRHFLHSAGLRYSLHCTRLPGKPDLVLTRRRSVVFVHGCFWHGHACKHGSVASKTNVDFWVRKIADNRARDARKESQLRAMGWHVEVVWECQCENGDLLSRLARRLLRR